MDSRERFKLYLKSGDVRQGLQLETNRSRYAPNKKGDSRQENKQTQKQRNVTQSLQKQQTIGRIAQKNRNVTRVQKIISGFKLNKDKSILMGMGAAICIGAVVCLVLLLSGEKIKTFKLTGGSVDYYVNETQGELFGEPYTCMDTTYVPAETLLYQSGYELAWDATNNTLTATNKKTTASMTVDNAVLKINDQDKSFATPVMMRDGVVYITKDMFSALSDNQIEIDGELKLVRIPVRDLLEDTSVTDEYRMNGSVEKYNGVYIIDGKVGMEQLSFSDSNIDNYVETVNNIAAVLPEVKVHDIVIPSMSEFYGPKEVYTDQIAGIRKIYQKLDEKVMPVNAVKEMWQHADEKLYFNTDHHWTQRGAYYAYKAFIENNEGEIADISTFTTSNSDTFSGSWTRELKGTQGGNELEANSEGIERFLPSVNYTGDIYKDMYMKERQGESVAVNPNDMTYTCFIYGDQPLTRYVTDVDNGKKLVIIKESFGNAFATWALNNYSEVYIIDPRYWGGKGGNNNSFSLRTFYDEVVKFDDLIVISYPGSTSSGMCSMIKAIM